MVNSSNSSPNNAADQGVSAAAPSPLSDPRVEPLDDVTLVPPALRSLTNSRTVPLPLSRYVRSLRYTVAGLADRRRNKCNASRLGVPPLPAGVSVGILSARPNGGDRRRAGPRGMPEGPPEQRGRLRASFAARYPLAMSASSLASVTRTGSHLNSSQRCRAPRVGNRDEPLAGFTNHPPHSVVPVERVTGHRWSAYGLLKFP